MVHITVVTQSNWTHSESHTRTQGSAQQNRAKCAGVFIKAAPNCCTCQWFTPKELREGFWHSGRCRTSPTKLRYVMGFFSGKQLPVRIAVGGHVTLYEQLLNSLPSAPLLDTETSAPGHNGTILAAFTRATQHCYRHNSSGGLDQAPLKALCQSNRWRQLKGWLTTS